jgi:hypothetical protein
MPRRKGASSSNYETIILFMVYSLLFLYAFYLLGNDEMPDFEFPGSQSYGSNSSKGEAEKLLGLSGNYTASDVRSAFREKSRNVHPDRNKSPEAAADFIKLTEAKEELLKTAI